MIPIPNFALNVRAWWGVSGAVTLRAIVSGERFTTRGSSVSIDIMAGARIVERMSCLRTSVANWTVSKRSINTTGLPARRANSTFQIPAHNARLVGIKLGIGRRGGGGVSVLLVRR